MRSEQHSAENDAPLGVQWGNCDCTWDPEFHRDLNVRRGKADQGTACTNPVHADAFGGTSGVCVACLFGCAE